MAYFQVSQGDFSDGTLVANGGQLMQYPLPLGINELTWTVNCDDTWSGGQYNAFVLLYAYIFS